MGLFCLHMSHKRDARLKSVNLILVKYVNTFNTGLTWKEALSQCPEGIVPACHNSQNTVTISGPTEKIRQFVTEMKEKEIFAREVNSSGVAFHSPCMMKVAPKLKEILSKVCLVFTTYQNSSL